MKEYILFEQLFPPGYWTISFHKDSKFWIDHRENDKPAHISSYGRKVWYNHKRRIKEEI